jgi:hypothetical protein
MKFISFFCRQNSVRSKFKCCICWEWESFEKEEHVKHFTCTTCKNDFHFQCISEWENHGGKTCPLCRTIFPKFEMDWADWLLYYVPSFPSPPSFSTIIFQSLCWIFTYYAGRHILYRTENTEIFPFLGDDENSLNAHNNVYSSYTSCSCTSSFYSPFNNKFYNNGTLGI